MGLDLEELKFGGVVVSIAEDELSASVNADEDESFVKTLYLQYLEAGRPKRQREWIRQELKKYFLFVTKPPKWIERTTVPEWPFFQGKPMVFIQQMAVPTNEVSKTAVSPDVVLYVFGARKPVDDAPGAWESVYKVVEQVRDL